MLFITIAMLCSCSKKEENTLKEVQSNPDFVINQTEFDNIGQLHNNAVDYIITNYIDEMTDFGTDTIGLMKFIQEKSLEYIATHNISFNGNYLDTSDGRLSNINLENLLHNQLVDRSSYEFYDRFENINPSYTYSQFMDALNDIENTNENESDSLKQVAIFIGTSIGKASGAFWNDKEENNEIIADKWVELGLTDLYGGLDAGMWGSFLGPGGAVVVGVNGAIIASCTSYLIGNCLP